MHYVYCGFNVHDFPLQITYHIHHYENAVDEDLKSFTLDKSVCQIPVKLFFLLIFEFFSLIFECLRYTLHC